MAGIISKQLAPNNQQSPVVYGADTKPYDAVTRDVGENETVAGQMSKLLATDSPYLQKARAGAMQTANSRGLLNSALAAGAGESAAISAALPIAQSDANTYGTAASQNQAYKNQAGQFNAGAENTANLNTAQAANALNTIDAQTESQKQLIGTQTEAHKQLQEQATALQVEKVLPAQTKSQVELQNIKGTQATELAQIEASYKQLLQASASSAALLGSVTKSINDIMADPNTSEEQKQAAVNHQTQMLESSLAVIGSIANIDLGSILNFQVA